MATVAVRVCSEPGRGTVCVTIVHTAGVCTVHLPSIREAEDIADLMLDVLEWAEYHPGEVASMSTIDWTPSAYEAVAE